MILRYSFRESIFLNLIAFVYPFDQAHHQISTVWLSPIITQGHNVEVFQLSKPFLPTLMRVTAQRRASKMSTSCQQVLREWK
jgi:hypothetical protein